LPVVALAAVGIWSLRQDKALAEHEAAERAQAVAEDLAARVWAGLSETNADFRWPQGAFEVDAAGRLISPPACAPVPQAGRFNVLALDARQLALWEEAQRAEAQGMDPAGALKAYRDLMDSAPPKEFAAVAAYSSGILLANTGREAAAAEMFSAVLGKYPDAVGESGLPMRPLAQWRLLGLEARAPSRAATNGVDSWGEFCAELVSHPTPLTPYLLERAAENAKEERVRAEAADSLRVWRRQEFSRLLFGAAKDHLQSAVPPARSLLSTASRDAYPLSAGEAAVKPTPGLEAPAVRAFWLRLPLDGAPAFAEASVSPDDEWLVVRGAAVGSDHWYLCRSESEIGSRLKVLVESSPQTPDYFGVRVALSGKTLARFAPDLHMWHMAHQVSKGGGHDEKQYELETATEVLGSAVKTAGGVELVRVSVLLTSPTSLFQRQRARTIWFGALIATAAVTALIGLLAAYRAFHRQLRLSELKSNFVSSVSHELRAPLASVRLMAESLERGKVAGIPRQQEYFRFIVQECRRLSSLIENVLDFSRIEQGRKRYEFEPTDLAALTRQTVKLMETYAAEREITLELQLDASPPGGENIQPAADGRALQQALINLIDNAVKHSDKGGRVVVGLECCTGSPPAQHSGKPGEYPGQVPWITLWVEDHGEGIPPGEHQRIFERFYRCGSELRRETQGVGIGLSIVKHIVEAHGGRILVRSAVGQGSRFTIELPVVSRP